MNKKLLIIGHGRHGKDTVGEILRDYHGRKFISSSEFVGRRAIWPNIQTNPWSDNVPAEMTRYGSFERCYEDRHNHRAQWAKWITRYNTPDKTRTASEMLKSGYDMYVGMRMEDELLACRDAGIFDRIVWVDRSKHLPEEPRDSMKLNWRHADLFIDNNGTLRDLWRTVDALVSGGMI